MVSVMCLKYTRSLHTLCSCLRNASRKGLKEEGELKKKICLGFFNSALVCFFLFRGCVTTTKEISSLSHQEKRKKLISNTEGGGFSAKEKPTSKKREKHTPKR